MWLSLPGRVRKEAATPNGFARRLMKGQNTLAYITGRLEAADGIHGIVKGLEEGREAGQVKHALDARRHVAEA